MPELDPEWEYFTADPEIEDLLALSPGVYDLGSDAARAGVRFGSGKPGGGSMGRVAREKVKPPPDPRPKPLAKPPDATCPACVAPFRRKRRGQRYCSPECKPKGGRPRLRPREAACCRCLKVFEPKQIHHHKYCSPACANRAAGARRAK